MPGAKHNRHVSLPNGALKSLTNGTPHVNGVANGTESKNKRGITIPEFFCVCSKYELQWLIQESAQYLASHLEKGSVPREEDAIYNPLVSPAHIRVEPARRLVWFPRKATGSGIELASSFLAGLIFVACNNDNVGNKASRVRAKITAVTMLKGVHAALIRSSTSDTLKKRLHAVRSIQASFLRRNKDLLGTDVKIDETSVKFDTVPADFIPLRPLDNYTLVAPESIIVTRPAKGERKPVDGPTSTLVIPSAGRSSRFPGMKPKWLLTMPNGRLMVVDALATLNLEKVHRVVLGILKEHVEKHCGSDVTTLLKAFEDGPAQLDNVEITIVVISRETVDQVQTIEAILKAANVTGPIFLKDCDNQFKCDIPGVDGVASLEITKDMQSLNIPAGKSYMTTDGEGFIDNIVEKVILGPTFCVGGYSFADGRDMLKQVNAARFSQRITNAGKIELAVSDVIWGKLTTGFCLRSAEDSEIDSEEEEETTEEGFVSIPVEDYEDWGTLQAWEAYARTFKALFLDIDGTLVKNSGGYFKPIWGMQPPLPKTVAHLQALYAKGRTQIILTTSRPESFREVTEKQLKEHGIPYDQIIFGMFHAQRVLVNDFAKTNPFPAAVAINLRRDGDEIPEMLGTY